MLSSQIHKRINFNFDKQKLVFDTSQELFSFAKVDDGTKELLNSLRKNPDLKYKKILDLGCGYGVIGIFLKNKFKDSEVLCTDRDSLAVDFAKHNAELNSVKIETLPSLDFTEVKDKFSLILTNFPAKLEKEGLEYFIAKSSEHLEKEGTLALVIVKELNTAIEEIIKNETISVTFKEKSKNYSVYHLKFKEKISSNFSYDSLRNEFILYDKRFILHTTHALREFDTPHIITGLIQEILVNKKFTNVSIINPGQGLIPLFVKEICSTKEINLISNDLLQLKISSENLLKEGFSNSKIENSNFAKNKADVLIWSIYDEDDKTIAEKLKIYIKSFQKIIIGGRISVLSRVLKKLNINSKDQIKDKGYIAIFINSL